MVSRAPANIAYLASFPEGDKSIGLRMHVWDKAAQRLDELALAAADRRKIETALAKKVPRVTKREREAMRRRVEKWRGVFRRA